MSGRSDTDRRRRVIAALVLAAAVIALLVWQWPRSSPEQGSTVDAPADDRARLPVAERPEIPRLKDDPTPIARQGEPPQAPIIDEIAIEKESVCRGEENLVTVRAHTPGHTDDEYLHYVVGGVPGNPHPLRSYPADDGEDPPVTVSVIGRDGARTTAEVPAFEVRDCVVPRRVIVTKRLMPNTLSEYEFAARVDDLGVGDPMVPVAYEWSFGDGATEVTDVPVVTHHYRDIPSDRLETYFPVEVIVTSAFGEQVRGRTTLAVRSRSFEHLHYKGIVVLHTLPEPRFPELDSDGVVRQTIRVWHDYDQPVTIARVVRGYHRGTGGSPEMTDLDPAAVLGASVIEPGQVVHVTAELDTERLPDVYSAEHQILGVSADGWAAFGAYAVMKPTEMPTEEDSAPVTDPMLAAKILETQRRLGKQYVTDEDIWRLEKEGAFDGLDPVDLEPTTREVELPKPRNHRGAGGVPADEPL